METRSTEIGGTLEMDSRISHQVATARPEGTLGRGPDFSNPVQCFAAHLEPENLEQK